MYSLKPYLYFHLGRNLKLIFMIGLLSYADHISALTSYFFELLFTNLKYMTRLKCEISQNVDSVSNVFFHYFHSEISDPLFSAQFSNQNYFL